MRRRLVVAFVGVTLVVLAVAWTSVPLSSGGSILPEILLGLVTLAGAALLAVVIAERLSRPFRELSAAAVQIGEGSFDAQIPAYSMPEAEQLGRSLRDAATRLADLVAHEQMVAVAASHELRTPITALRLSLEDLTLWKQTPPEVADELNRSINELDRLSLAVTQLLGRTHTESAVMDLAQLAAEVVASWRPRTQVGTIIELDAPGPMLVRAPRPSVRQVLDTILAYATTSSVGDVSVDVARLGQTVRVRVSRDGPRALPTGVIHGTTSVDDTDGSPALAEAGAVATSMGGYLGVEDLPGLCLVLLVPAADDRRV